MPNALKVLAALALLIALPSAGEANEALEVPDAWVEEALEAAGANRAELEMALASFQGAGDPRKQTALRFLVANMPEKGYVVTWLGDEAGRAVSYDPTDHPTFREALAALDQIETEHGAAAFKRDRPVLDVQTVQGAFLVRHVNLAFEAWERVPEPQRISFEAFLEHVLPYRGSEEPLDDWLDPLLRRYAAWWPEAGADADPATLYRRVSKDIHARVRFDERYYLHPTDQSFTEMGRSGLGRCEDITNMITFAARSLGLATAADFTPAWGHRDNNHAWNVLLDSDGRGSDPANAHAAKIYRKTFSIQRDGLPFRLPEGQEAPNRFLASKTIRDVTDSYAETTDVTVSLDPDAVADERFAYLCVFNGGAWTAVHWGQIERTEGQDLRVTFDRMGRNLLYLPAVYDGEALIPAAAPLLVEPQGRVMTLAAEGEGSVVLLTASKPRQKSPDTLEETPVSYLTPGATYVLKRWAGKDWHDVMRFVAEGEARRAYGLLDDALYWLVEAEGRGLERPFVVAGGRQRFR